MVKKIMRVFIDVANGKMDLKEVEISLNPSEDKPRAYINVIESKHLILMDIQ